MNASPTSLRRSRLGFGLLDGLMGLAIMAGVVLAGARMMSNGIMEEAARGQSTRWVALTKAGQDYLRTQDSAIDAVFDQNPTAVITIPLTDKVKLPNQLTSPVTGATLPSLQRAGVLGYGVSDVSVNGQSTVLVIYRPPSAFDFEAVMMSYGGAGITDATIVRTEGLSDARVGGFLTTDPLGGSVIRGQKGGWAIPSTDLSALSMNLPGTGVAGPVSPGHLFSYLTLQKSALGEKSRYLARDKDANPENNRMTTDIYMAGRGLDGIDHLCGSTNGSSPSNPYDTGCDANRKIAVGGDMVSNAGIFAASQVASNASMVAPAFYSGTTAGADQPDKYVLKPSGGKADGSRLNDLKTTSLSLDTNAYSTKRDLPSGITLADLIPNEVIKASFVAKSGDIIPKPDCGDGGAGVGTRQRIFASYSSFYNEANPQTTVNSSVGVRPVNVVTSYSVNSDSHGGYNVSITTDKVNSFESIMNSVSSTAGATFNGLFATNNGASWVVYMGDLSRQADGTFQLVNGNAGNHPDQALVQTACFYGTTG